MRRSIATLAVACLLATGCSFNLDPDLERPTPPLASVQVTTTTQPPIVPPVPDPAKAIQTGGENVVRAGTLQMGIVAEVVGGDPTAIVGKGAFDLRRNLGQLRLTLPSERGSLDVVNVGNTYYVKGKQVSRLTQGRPWLGIDVASLPADQRQRLLGTSRLPAATDPKTEMVLLGGLTGEVVDLGPSTPDELGPVRGYRITADLRKLAPKLQPDQRQRFQKLGITQLPVEVFLDGFGYLRRIRYTLEPPRLVSGPGVGVTADFSGFGIPVRITPPPTAKVTFLR